MIYRERDTKGLSIDILLDKIKQIPNCIIHEPTGLPTTHLNHILPDDVKLFYKLCGGVSLYVNSDYPLHIVNPSGFLQANPIIVGETCEYDISFAWYILANDGNGDYFTIDLDPIRTGRCYDSFWDCHGVRGECRIIATSFTDFLNKMIDNSGMEWYFNQESFMSLGDAYDGILE